MGMLWTQRNIFSLMEMWKMVQYHMKIMFNWWKMISDTIPYQYEASDIRPVACSKKTKFLNFILQLCPGLCIYVKNHQKKIQDFWGHSFGPPLILRFSISTFMRRRRRSLLRTFLGVLDSCSVAEWPGNLILTYFEYSWLSVLQKLPELCLIQMTEYKETRNL